MTDEYFDFDVGLSFAGEQRAYVEEVASNLKSRGIRPFYDDYEREVLWGKDLYAHLSEVYQHLCRYCVIFVSKEYEAKVWTNKERQSAQARAIEERHEYILPARFDDTPIPGLPDTVGYIDLSKTSPEELCDLIAGKLGKRTRREFLPPNLDRLFARLDIAGDEEAQDEAALHARVFLQVLRRMTNEERRAVIDLFRFSCPSGLPDNVHISADLLRRVTDNSVARLQTLLGGIRSLGFECSIRQDTKHGTDMPGTVLGDDEFFYLTWVDLHTDAGEFPELLVAREMLKGATEDFCEECGAEFLERLDFSQLASATASTESDQVGG